MVNGINWNPFLGREMTPQEIQEMDTNFDGKVDERETKRWQGWTSYGQDSEGTVEFGEDNPLVIAAKANGMTDTANNKEEFQANIAILKDQYLESYMSSHRDMSDSERSSFISFVDKETTKFIDDTLKQYPNGPYNMTEFAIGYEDAIETARITNETNLKAARDTVVGFENDTQNRYSKMVELTQEHFDDKYLTSQQWQLIKNQAVPYLIGSLISGEPDTELLTNINKNYQKNSYYQAALKAIQELQNCQDPEKIKQLLVAANDNLTKFLDQAGSSNVANAILKTEETKRIDNLTAALPEKVDKWVESHITASMSDKEKQAIKDFAKDAMSAFIEDLKSNQDKTPLSSLEPDSVAQKFDTFINTRYNEYKVQQNKIKSEVNQIDYATTLLISNSDSVKSNGYVNESEKATLVALGSDLIFKQMLSGMEDIPLLSNLNSGYKASADYKELQTIITKIGTSFDADEIQELITQAKEIISKLLNKYSGDQLVSAIDFIKPVQVDSTTMNNAIYNSSIGSDYSAGITRTAGGYVDYNEGSNDNNNDMSSQPKDVQEGFKALQEKARKDMEAYAEQLKLQLKSQLGAAYNEAEIDKIIQDAITETIMEFSDPANLEGNKYYQRRWGDDGDYEVPDGKRGFYFCERKRSHGRWGYNLKALIDAFTENFNSEAKEAATAKNNKSAVTYDRENVLMESGIAQDYVDGSDESSGWEKVGQDSSQRMRAKAVEKLAQLANALRASLLAEGCSLSSAETDKLIDKATENTLNNAALFDIESFSLGSTPIASIYHFDIKDVADYFLNEFDKLYADAI